MLSNCRYVTFSVVELPPSVPHPNIIDCGRPVVMPQHPCAPGEFTRIRLAGMLDVALVRTHSVLLLGEGLSNPRASLPVKVPLQVASTPPKSPPP